MNKHNGFTIVELLIVIVVVGILAAISFVAYRGIQDKTYDAIVEQDLSTFRKKLEMVKIQIGRYPRTHAEFPSDLKISKRAYDTISNNVYYIVDFTSDTYALGVRSKSSRGYILLSSGEILRNTTFVNAAATASANGMTWGNDGTKLSISGYVADTNAWYSDWPYSS
jgi:prepilin-type N-terminal cleavage/methylation domain-containing protein